MNQTTSDRYREIDTKNRNAPLLALVCPQCESTDVYRDKELSDHPGVFSCRRCTHTFCA